MAAFVRARDGIVIAIRKEILVGERVEVGDGGVDDVGVQETAELGVVVVAAVE